MNMAADVPSNPNLQAALLHAAAGRPVFPCSPVHKRPMLPKSEGGKGYKDATVDAAQIQQWWSRWPDAVPGMPTGQRVGVFVLDVDVKNGAQGDESLRELIGAFGALPDTAEVLTASGGRHLYFRHPRDGRLIPNRASRLGLGHETWGREGFPDAPFEVAANGQLITPGLDIRGDGGYVILPGSVMADGRRYEWEASSDPADGVRAAEAPAWLLALVASDPAAPAQGGGPSDAPTGPIAEGGRNDFLYRLGCSLRAKGLSEGALMAALMAENAARCAPPLPEPEVRTIAQSASSKPAGLSPEYQARAARSARRPEARPDLRVVGGTEHRPSIRIVAGDLPGAVDAGEAALLSAKVDVFQHGNRLVRVGRWEAAPGPVARPTGAGVLIDISAEWLVESMTRVCVWERYDRRSDSWLPTDAPSKVAKTLLARQGEWRFSHLLGFCDSPTLLPDGRVVSAAGFDAESGLYLSNPPSIPPIGSPTKADAQAALKRLIALFETFPFCTASDISALIATVITGVNRRVLPAAPIFGISASTPGSGKSLLADAISSIITGRTCAVVALGKDGEELEKRLDSILLKGDAVTCFDNVDRPVKSDVLCQVTTQSHKSIRVLAQSRIVEAPTNCLLLMTGNNLTLLGDLTRRAVMIHLDAGVERPEMREFERDAIEHVLKHRPQAIHDALVIAKAYIDAGCPKVPGAPFGSFEVWDRLVRRPLIWLGMADPLLSAESLRSQDHELTDVQMFLESWERELGPAPIVAADLYERITAGERGFSGAWAPANPGLYEAAVSMMGATNKWGPKELGYRLRAWAGRIVDGLRVVQSSAKTAKGRAWAVERVR